MLITWYLKKNKFEKCFNICKYVAFINKDFLSR